MNIRIKPELESLASCRGLSVAAFTSIDNALEHSIELASTPVRPTRPPSRSIDLSWTKPLIEQAEASIAAGKCVDFEDAFGRIDRHLKSLG